MKDGEVRDFGRRDKIGYMFGDFGNDFTFIFASSFLMVFYTKVAEWWGHCFWSHDLWMHSRM